TAVPWACVGVEASRTPGPPPAPRDDADDAGSSPGPRMLRLLLGNRTGGSVLKREVRLAHPRVEGLRSSSCSCGCQSAGACRAVGIRALAAGSEPRSRFARSAFSLSHLGGLGVLARARYGNCDNVDRRNGQIERLRPRAELRALEHTALALRRACR